MKRPSIRAGLSAIRAGIEEAALAAEQTNDHRDLAPYAEEAAALFAAMRELNHGFAAAAAEVP